MGFLEDSTEYPPKIPGYTNDSGYSCTTSSDAASGSDALFGFIGPATPAQLEGAVVTATWAGTDKPDQQVQLQRVLPHVANSWLIAHS
jgi:hypothetical protein